MNHILLSLSLEEKIFLKLYREMYGEAYDIDDVLEINGIKISKNMKNITQKIKSYIANSRPSFMVPNYIVPIDKIPCSIDVVADTTAMSKPHEIEYTLYFSEDETEDEDIVEYALSICPDLKVLPIKMYDGFASGLTTNTKNCVRLYPHKIKGEGHFVALLQKGERKNDGNKE